MIKVQKLKYQYKSEDPMVFPDLQCNAGESYLILGNSGVGKTTLLHLIGGILKIQQGTVLINEKDLAQVSLGKMDDFRGQNIGIIFQQAHFLKSLTIKENLLLTRKLAGLNQNENLILNLLTKLNLSHKLDSYPIDMSVGEKQRAAIARALCTEPKVILADEPTSALDDENCDEVIRLIREVAEGANAALLIVTHDTRLKAIFPNQILLN